MRFLVGIVSIFLAEITMAQNDISASFPGGSDAYNRYLSENLQFPQLAIDSQASREIRALIGIDTMGALHIEDFIFDYSALGFEEEVQRFVKSMPNWEPAIHNGVKAYSQIILTFNFTYVDPDLEYDEFAYRYYEESDVPPMFEGGHDSIMRFIRAFLIDTLQLSFDTAYARLTIIVDDQGRIIDGQILESDNKIADGYWLHAFKNMPSWKPGSIGGKTVYVQREVELTVVSD